MFASSSSSAATCSATRSATQIVPRTGASGRVRRPVSRPTAASPSRSASGRDQLQVHEAVRGQRPDVLQLHPLWNVCGKLLDGGVEVLQPFALHEKGRV